MVKKLFSEDDLLEYGSVSLSILLKIAAKIGEILSSPFLKISFSVCWCSQSYRVSIDIYRTPISLVNPFFFRTRCSDDPCY